MASSERKASVFVEIEAGADITEVESNMQATGFNIQRRIGRVYLGVIDTKAIKMFKWVSGVKAAKRSVKLDPHRF